MIRVRTRAAWSCSCQLMWNASATQETPRSSSASPAPSGGTQKCTRMKNRPSGRSVFGWPYCWLARMLAECWTRKLDTAYTIPGLSGQDSVSTYSRLRAAFMTTSVVAYRATHFVIRNNTASPDRQWSTEQGLWISAALIGDIVIHDPGHWLGDERITREYRCAMSNNGPAAGESETA